MKEHSKKKFPPPYFAIEEDKKYACVYTNTGEYSVIFQLYNPILRYSTNRNEYYAYNELISQFVKTLGVGYCIQKHDIFIRDKFTPPESDSETYLQNRYFSHFTSREYTRHITYITIIQQKKKGIFNYSKSKWEDFNNKVEKALDILNSSGFEAHPLNKQEATNFIYRYISMDFVSDSITLDNILATEKYLKLGDKKIISTPVVDIDEVDLPNSITPDSTITLNGTPYTTDIVSFLADVPDIDTLVYHQAIFIPSQQMEAKRLATKTNRHSSLPSTANKLAAEDIKAVEIEIEANNKLYVYMHYNILTVGKKLNKAINFLESKFSTIGIRLSKNGYNQFELYVASFPGQAYKTNEKYDRFLTLNDVAGCLQYKERETYDEQTPLKVYYTNRAGIPKAIDFTGKEGAHKLTTNSNFFCLGPSGSGKSFHMNSVLRQLAEQDTDIVLVDTGHSYEGLCSFLGGTYITYSEDNPISMNPFRISKEEYNIEKINFIKSLIEVIWKGSDGVVSSVEDEFIHRTIDAYYRFYFNPFQDYSEEEYSRRQKVLMLEYRNDKKKHRTSQVQTKLERRLLALQQHVEQNPGNEGLVASKKIEEMKDKYSLEIDEITSLIEFEIQEEQEYLRNIHVTELSFNGFFEFALEYIPFLQSESKVEFDINQFRFLLSKFYKGGAMSQTLNKDMDSSLFDEKFVVFEIDAIKDDPTLFPIVTLIIMDLFLQKMRLKKNRKALVIEEAWKAIASDLMAGYILYLYKTVRKFWGIVGVVTQEIEDIISSEVVKSAIINNSEITILLDQTKLKDRFDDVKSLLGLTDIECSKIWTINNLENKDGRGVFKEVYIRRGLYGEVYGVEESLESYMAYTTEKVEKEALALYRQKCDSIEEAIQKFCKDWRNSGMSKAMEFSKYVLQKNKQDETL